MNKPFRTLIRVRYAECDAQLVVFNARYGDYVDLATTEYMRALFGSYQAVMERGYDYQVVKLSTDFKSPARFDDVLAIDLEVGKLGNSSFSYQLTFSEYYSNRTVAVSEIIYVMMTYPDYEKTPIPDFYREALTKGTGDIIMNYAGIDLGA